MLKRIFDVVVSLSAIALLFPVILLVAVLIKFKLGSPILFSQNRPGLDGQVFKMLKFRTMRDVIDTNGKPLPDSERMTKFGAFLRSTSLDELPGLFNVLKGEMSLVGPRPLLEQYLPLYSTEQARRHNVRPGITGWAQVNGRNAISWQAKFNYDVWYVDNKSFWLDLKILFLTVKKVFIREGINADGEATMAAFTGNENEISFPDLYIVGAGGFAREVYSYLSASDYIYKGGRLKGFLDDNKTALTNFDFTHKIVGDLKCSKLKETDLLIVAVASPNLKQHLLEFYGNNSGNVITYIHPTATVGSEVKVGDGTIFAPYSLATSNIVIGKGCTINAFSSIGHDAVLGDFCTLSGHCDVTGNVILGDKVFMGSHASIIPKVQVGTGAVIGAGSLVIRNVKENTTVFGNPAKKIM